MKADEGAVARRYARAAMLFCDEKGGHEGFQDGLHRFLDALRSVPSLRALLTTPILKGDRQVKLAQEVGRHLAVPESAARFIGLLLRKGRMEYLEAIGRRFGELLDEKRGRVRGTVRTPAALPEGAKVALTDALGRYFGKKVVAAFVVDESLYGGVVARVGNLVLDSSLKGRLDRIRQRIQGMTA